MNKKVFQFLILLILVTGFFSPAYHVHASQPRQLLTPQQKAEQMLARMSPAEKVGQLFLATFSGTSTETGSQVYNLLTEQHVGGVVLRSDNDNFTGPEETAENTQTLIRSLQKINWDHIQAANETALPGERLNYVPLLVGVSQEGDLSPYDQIINDLTPLPNEMAIGATWNVANAETVGNILGNELHALGFNLLLGPSLDVLDVIKTDTGEDLGVRTFGGDPYWVAEMGQAFIRGIHGGSGEEMAVIATHFPGRGESDRQPEDEVATVRKSLEQLKQIELAPFFAVTGTNSDANEIVEGLLLSHIRYQGFQGNIRATTRPVSFDPAALEQLMSLPEFSRWVDAGGIIVSDDLGSAAVRKFFDPMNTSFDARQVIKSALLAGNDLLYTGNIVATGDPDSFTTLARTHEFFVQKYNEDTAFQQRVDQAVLRVLTLKYTLYPSFLISDTLTDASDLEVLGTSEQQIFDIARQSVTLVSPELTDLDAVIPEPPALNERIVFISDQVTQAQCSTCQDQSISLAKNLRNAVERLYGPKAGEQVQSYRLTDYSFDDLEKMLNGNDAPANMLTDIQSANWLVISFTEFEKESDQSVLFKRFFLERPELTRNKKVIGFAFNAPYYLDATDISKLTAYYAVYSKIPVFVDVAARILFQEITPEGILPVSVTSVGYDLIVATTPDPNQVIPLLVDDASALTGSTIAPSVSPEVSLIYKVGDTIPLRTGIIVDHNGHPVPDGTVVRFLIDTRSASGSIEQIETQTLNGIAQTTYRIQNIGKFELKVTADPAIVSQILSLDITEGGGQITSFEPTSVPTVSPFTTEVPEGAENFDTPRFTSHDRGILSVADWLLSSLIVFGVAGVFFGWGRIKQKQNWSKVPFLAGLTGYLVYLYFGLGLPGTMKLVLSGRSGLVFLFVFAGSLAGGVLGLLWNRIARKKDIKTTA